MKRPDRRTTGLVAASIAAAAAVAVGGVAAVNAVGESPQSTTVMMATGVPSVPWETFKKFVVDMQASSYYPKWVAANCGASSGGTPAQPRQGTDAYRWFTFRDALLARQRPDVPGMTTFFGRALTGSGQIVLNSA